MIGEQVGVCASIQGVVSLPVTGDSGSVLGWTGATWQRGEEGDDG